MLSLDMEQNAADCLSAGLCLLKDLTTTRPVPCSALLRHLVRDLVELSGPTAGEVTATAQIEPLALPSVKRRALVLAACNLLLHFISGGYSGRSRGTLLVSLRRIGGCHARLTVADDGCAKDRDQAPEVLEAIEDLTAIFHGHFTSRYDHRGG
jgi:hypothetical protein